MALISKERVSIKEKIGYSLGDGAANIAWRGVATFLFIFYTDVFGIDPVAVGLLLLVARLSDGVSDVLMGVIGDRTNSKHGKFRPWILWSAIPLGAVLAMLFTAPDFSTTGKIIYAYTTYILFTLIYTANNIPYGALMAVMTGDNKERTSIGSYRMVGAFAGGMLVQGAMLYLVATFGNVDPEFKIAKIAGKEEFRVEVMAKESAASANIKTKSGVGQFYWASEKDLADTPTESRTFSINPEEKVTFLVSNVVKLSKDDFSISSNKVEVDVRKAFESDDFEVIVTALDTLNSAVISSQREEVKFSQVLLPISSVSFKLEQGEKYEFVVSNLPTLESKDLSIINQKDGYQYSIYLLSFFLIGFMLITYFSTKERVQPPKTQESNLRSDLKDLIKNKPWIVLLLIGLIFNTYNSIKQGVTVIYFTHYLHKELLAGSYMVGLTLASILGAMVTSPLGKTFGKKKLFIYSLIFSGVVNALLIFCSAGDVTGIFALGIISEFGAAIFPTLFFAMLGDAADYSEFMNGRRATGLIYSAGSFATKFGGGIAGAIIGFVLASYNYSGQDPVAIQKSEPGIIYLMSWIPAVIAVVGAAVMAFYPLNQTKMDEITVELEARREADLA